MVELTLIERIVVSKDWATLIFLLSFSIIAANRNLYEIRFSEFIRLGFSTKYIKIYKDTNNLRNSFTLSFFFIQLIAGTFFIQICLKSFGYIPQYSFTSFLRILNFVSFFILSKYLIEKIIATTFGIEDFVAQFNLQKVNYRNFISMLILPVVLVLFYNEIDSKIPLYVIMVALLATNVFLYIFFLKNYQKAIMSKLFYFILYLCTLEIAPYFFLYYWFTKS